MKHATAILALLAACGVEYTPKSQPQGAPMPPPDDWNVNGAAPTVWGTDVASATDQIYEGTSSWKFPSGSSVAGRLDSDFIAIPAGAPFEVQLAARVSNVAQHVRIFVEFYNQNLSSLGNETIEWTLTNANRWELYRKVISGARGSGQADARFVLVQLGKWASGANNLWLTPLVLHPAKRSFRMYDNAGAQTINSGAFRLIDFDTIEYDNGGVAVASAGASAWDPAPDASAPIHDAHTANYKTLWHFDAAVTIASMADGKFLRIALFKNGTEVARGTCYRSGGDVTDPTALVSADLLVEEDDTVDVRVIHDDGANPVTVPGSATVWFTGHEI